MSQKEMDQMDQECENVVNSAATPEAKAAAEAIANEWYEENDSKCEPDPCCECGPGEPVSQRVNGRYTWASGAIGCTKVASYAWRERNRRRRQLVARIVLCLLTGTFFVAVLVKPSLIPWLVNAGVLCCGIVMAVGIDRHCRRPHHER